MAMPNSLWGMQLKIEKFNIGDKKELEQATKFNKI